MELIDLGYGPDFQRAFVSLGRPELRPARVVREDRGRLHVDDGDGPRPAELLGRLRQEDPRQWPAVGDWVALDRLADGPSIVHAVLPRRSAFVRGRAGRRHADQCVAANVDTLFIAMGLDADFNVRRLERYLVLAGRSGARPVVLLTKADCCPDPEALAEQAREVGGKAPVHVICAPRGEGLDALRPYLSPGSTVAVVGSSGAGKSTLANRLLGGESMATAPIRSRDGRGQHTTRHRQLLTLPGGVTLIDTPGMRELRMRGDEDDLPAAFGEIEARAASCRFRDCEHEREPGCAVREAVEKGELDPSRLAAFAKLRAEMRSEAERRESGGHQARRRGRRFGRMVAEARKRARR